MLVPESDAPVNLPFTAFATVLSEGGGLSHQVVSVHGSVLVSAWSYQAPSHCTPLLGQVPLVAGTAHLSTPVSVPPGTSSIFFPASPSLPFVSDSQFLLLVFFTAGQFSLLTHIRTPQFMVSAASESLFWEDFWFLDYCVSITQPRQVLIRTC